MKLRTWLLLSFVLFTLLIVVLFGTITYRIAIDNQVEREIDRLHHSLKEQAAAITARKRNIRLREWLQTAESGQDIYQVLDRNAAGELRPIMSSTATTPIDNGVYVLLQEQIDAGKIGGQISLRDQPYLWVTAKIAAGSSLLLTLHQLDHHVTSPLRTLGIRIVAAGTVAVWVAVWGGLVVSGLFEKRQKKHDAILIHQALHDELTGLPKRKLLHDRLLQAVLRAQRERHNAALLIMDLDRFKEINDTLGHHSGDELLQHVGNRLRQALRKSDTVARLGGDEFAILAPDCNIEQAILIAKKTMQIMEPPCSIHGMEVAVQPSIGIAVYPEHGEDADAITRHADVAMYQAKHGGGYAVYAPEADPHSLQRLALMGELRMALARDQTTLHYQPQVDSFSGRVTGVEALARWNHPERGFIRPDEFIAIAKSSGQIKTLTDVVLRQAFRQYQAWHQAGVTLNISLNLSARNLHDSGLPARIARLLAAWNVPPASIRLEITESAMLVDPAKAKRILSEFDAMGLGLAIDDFGTGYSSLSYLKQLPVNIIKIDKSFVMNMIRDEDDASIVRATIDLAHNLGLKVVAEGVENEETGSALRALGCDYLQGYHISKPLPADEIVRWLSRRQAPRGGLAGAAT